KDSKSVKKITKLWDLAPDEKKIVNHNPVMVKSVFMK
ncbi:MAG: hypothetical protein ACI8W0_001876, partial [Flavobacterium sp.]